MKSVSTLMDLYHQMKLFRTHEQHGRVIYQSQVEEQIKRLVMNNLDELSSMINEKYPQFEIEEWSNDPVDYGKKIRYYVLRAADGTSQLDISRTMGRGTSLVGALMTTRINWNLDTLESLYKAIWQCRGDDRYTLIHPDGLIVSIEHHFNRIMKRLTPHQLATVMGISTKGAKLAMMLNGRVSLPRIERLLSDAKIALENEKQRIRDISFPQVA